MKFGKFQSFTPSFLGWSIMDRYIAMELIVPFLFGVGLFSSVGVAIGAVFDLIRKITDAGLPIEIALQAMLLKMPEFIVYAFPMSILLATLMAYNRLSNDSELIALRSIGVSPYRLVLPAIALSFFVTGLTFLFNEYIVPTANYQAEIILDTALNKNVPTFQYSNIFYPEYRSVQDPDGKKRQVLNRLFYAEQFNGKSMKGLTILDRSQEGVSQIVTAQSAMWNIRENRWDFFNGTMYLINQNGSYRNIVRFEHQQLQLPKAPLDIAQEGRDSNQMNILQLARYIDLIQMGADEKKVQKLKVRLAQKISFPFVCLVFGLVGAALGNRSQSKNRATSFGISVFIIFGYYLLSFITGALGLVEVLSPFMAAWLPNFLGFGVGGVLLIQSSR
ncbi:MAG: LptF/LptG family permease [Chroococcales cyanobacterium]